MGQRLGVDVREISRRELNDIEPRIDLADVHRMAYEPRSGYCDPRTCTHAYVQRFIELGGSLRQLTAVQSLITEGNRVKGVRTDGGDISAAAVVNAAGPWADRVARVNTCGHPAFKAPSMWDVRRLNAAAACAHPMTAPASTLASVPLAALSCCAPW